MNLTTPPPSAAPRSPSTDTPSCRRDDEPAQGAREAFERVLQAKRQAPRDEEDDTPCDGEASATAMASFAAAPALVRTVAVPIGAGAGAVDTATSGPRAAIQAALNANSGPPVASILGTDPAAVWEASVRGPHHMAIDLRAERITTQGMPPGWGLTIASPAQGAELLARHAPRLNERLRKQGVELDHVRIESFDEEDKR